MKLKLKLPGQSASQQPEPSTSTVATAQAQPAVSSAASLGKKRKEPSADGNGSGPQGPSLATSPPTGAPPPAKRISLGVGAAAPGRPSPAATPGAAGNPASAGATPAGTPAVPRPRIKLSVSKVQKPPAAGTPLGGNTAPNSLAGTPLPGATPGPFQTPAAVASGLPFAAGTPGHGVPGSTSGSGPKNGPGSVAKQLHNNLAGGPNAAAATTLGGPPGAPAAAAGGPPGSAAAVEAPSIPPAPPLPPRPTIKIRAPIRQPPQPAAPAPAQQLPPAPPLPGPAVKPAASAGDGPPIKKIKLNVKMPNLANLAARIARGETTAPAPAAGAAAGPAEPAGPAGAAPLARPGLPALGPLGAPGGPGAPGGLPRLPLKLKIAMPGSKLAAKPAVVSKPAVITTIKKDTGDADGLDDDEEDDDYGPDPDFLLPKRGRGRGRGGLVRGGGLGRGGGFMRGGGGRGMGAPVARPAVAAPKVAPAPPPVVPLTASRLRSGRGGDHASRFELERVFEQIVKQDKEGLFAKPVTDEVAPGYSDVIKTPMDLSAIRTKLSNGEYTTWASIEADLMLMSQNAKTYNPEGSKAWWYGDLMEKMSKKYLECGRQGMTNFRGVAASVWREMRKGGPGAGIESMPLLPRYTSAGPREKVEREAAERARMAAERQNENQGLMLESRLRERRPVPGSMAEEGPAPEARRPERGPGGLGGLVGPGRRKHRGQGLRMIEADAKRLMASQAGDNRFTCRPRPNMSSVPFVLMGGLSNGASAEGVPYTVVRPALQPAYLPCDKLVSAYATSIARFVSKCGKAVQLAAMARLVELPPPPKPAPQPATQLTGLSPSALPQPAQQPQLSGVNGIQGGGIPLGAGHNQLGAGAGAFGAAGANGLPAQLQTLGVGLAAGGGAQPPSGMPGMQPRQPFGLMPGQGQQQGVGEPQGKESGLPGQALQGTGGIGLQQPALTGLQPQQGALPLPMGLSMAPSPMPGVQQHALSMQPGPAPGVI